MSRFSTYYPSHLPENLMGVFVSDNQQFTSVFFRSSWQGTAALPCPEMNSFINQNKFFYKNDERNQNFQDAGATGVRSCEREGHHDLSAESHLHKSR